VIVATLRRRPVDPRDATDAASVVEKVEVSNWAITLLLALIGVIPPLVTVGVGALMTQFTQQTTTAVEKTKLEATKQIEKDKLQVTAAVEKGKLDHEIAKLALDSRKASSELYRRALAVEDPAKRRTAVQFLLNAKLVDPSDAVPGMPADQLPYLPATSP